MQKLFIAWDPKKLCEYSLDKRQYRIFLLKSFDLNFLFKYDLNQGRPQPDLNN